MPFEPLRFLHAANLCLDATLQCTIALPPDTQTDIEDATLDAFDNIIRACIEKRVDFLLLTGNCFIERERSLRARLALRDGFRELDEHGIAVFVTPGELDPPEAWQSIPELPDNVSVCYPSNPEPVAVMRDGRVIATIANNLFYGEADHFGIKSSPSTGERRPYRIGMLHPARLAEIEAANGPLTYGDDDDFELSDIMPDLREGDEVVRDELTSSDFTEPQSMAVSDVGVEVPGPAESIAETLDPRSRHEDDRETSTVEALKNESPDVKDAYEYSEVEQTLAAFLRQALVDYAVLIDQTSRRTIRLKSGLAHCPGRIQPLAGADHGKHGATLVVVDSTGLAKCRRIPTVTTRWKSFDVDLTGFTEADQIYRQCRTLLAAEPREQSERTWLVRWNFVGPPAVVDDFENAGYRERFAQAIDSTRTKGEPDCVHSFRAFSGGQAPDGVDDNVLIAQFNELAAELEIDDELLQQVIPNSAKELAWNDRLRALVSELDRDLIAAHLRRFGGHWFGRIGELEPLVETEAGVVVQEALDESGEMRESA